MKDESQGGISPYDRMRFADEELCAMLAAGSARRELTALFGAAEYAQLAALARAARQARQRHPEPVYLLPGIMGTQLGARRPGSAPADLLWLDPQDVIGGALQRLRMPDAGGLVTLGTIPYTYLALQLRLRAAGFAVRMHEYDWRQDLSVLAAAFAARLHADPAPGLHIVAHSMGGLIARRALCAPELARVRRLVTLGTPHRGSYGAVQAIRGTYPVVRRLAAIDLQHDAEFLAAQVFGTYPSIHQMLPPPDPQLAIDLFDADSWPLAGPRPDGRLLAEAQRFVQALPAAEPRCIAICGTHQRTVTGLEFEHGEFQYQVSDAGDGTVPLARAQLRGSDHYFVRCEHSELPRSPTVARALVQLLRHGRSSRLARAPGPRLGRAVRVSDTQLRSTWTAKCDWAALSPAERRRYLNELNQPPPHYAPRHAGRGRGAEHRRAGARAR